MGIPKKEKKQQGTPKRPHLDPVYDYNQLISNFAFVYCYFPLLLFNITTQLPTRNPDPFQEGNGQSVQPSDGIPQRKCRGRHRTFVVGHWNYGKGNYPRRCRVHSGRNGKRLYHRNDTGRQDSLQNPLKETSRTQNRKKYRNELNPNGGWIIFPATPKTMGAISLVWLLEPPRTLHIYIRQQNLTDTLRARRLYYRNYIN